MNSKATTNRRSSANTRVAERTGFDLKVVRDYMEVVIVEGMLTDGSDSGGRAGAITARGRIALSKKPRRSPQGDIKMTGTEIRRRILQTIRDSQSNSGITVQDSVIAEKTGSSVQNVQDHLDVLEDEGRVQLAKTTAGYGAWMTARGRLGLQEPLERELVTSMATLSKDAIKRLILAAIHEGQGQNVCDAEIAEKSGLDLQVVRDHLDVLRDEEMLVLAKSLDGSRSARLNAQGRLALREKRTMSEPVNLYPVEIQESLARFRVDHPDEAKVAFIVMRFGQTGLHEKVVKGIKSALEPHGITGLRADDKQYHDDLFNNVLTYIHGCGLGIAVFERIESNEFNPNVSLEVGYMMALRRPVCLLKDKTLGSLHSDLVGKLYRSFDAQDPIRSIPPVLCQWLMDKGLA